MVSSGISATTGRDDFLKLLVAQLSNQDPLQPVEQHSFIAELAQFSTLEGIERLNGSFDDMIRMQQLTQGVDIIGKEVRYQAFGEASPDRTGVVEAVTSRQGVMYLMVNQEFVPLSSVYSVGLPGGTG